MFLKKPECGSLVLYLCTHEDKREIHIQSCGDTMLFNRLCPGHFIERYHEKEYQGSGGIVSRSLYGRVLSGGGIRAPYYRPGPGMDL